MNLTNLSAIREIADKFGFTFSKSLGQNFLINPSVCPRIAEMGGADENTGVIEIGAGFGVLTQELAKRAKKVVAVELDSRLIPVLQYTLADYDNVKVINEDVLKVDLPKLIAEEFPGMDVVVCANLPYYITSPILTALLEAECFRSVTVMVQKEVAQRIAAQPGSPDYSAFSIFCQYYAKPEILFDVPAGCFLPQPKVTSAVITLKVREEKPWDIPEPEIFFRAVRASFAMRRKKLQNGLASGFPQLGKAGAAEVIAAAGLPENVRGETLGIPEFARLSKEISGRLHHD